MQIEKIREEIEYQINDGDYYLQVTVIDSKTLSIAKQLNFLDSKPEFVAAVGRMLIAASELVSNDNQR